MPDGRGKGRADGPAERTSVLVATSQFPVSGGSRVDKFVSLLPEFGFDPTVICAAETSTPASRRLLATLYPETLRVHQARSLGRSFFTERFIDRGPGARHYRLLGALSFPERCVYVPDYMVRWTRDGIRQATRLVQENNISVVLTSSPPESTHLIGLALKQALGIRWVADFRDLWTTKKLLYRPATPVHDWYVRRLERKILAQADHVIANTNENMAFYQDHFGVPSERVSLIPNGFDRDDIRDLPTQPSKTVFRMGYMGNLSKHGFPWKVFLEAFIRLARTVGSGRVRLDHCGFCSPEIREFLRENGPTELVQFHGQLSHHEAMRITANTDLRLALLYENEYSDSIVPAKLYHYLVMDGPILAIAPERGAVARILAETQMGVVVTPSCGVDRLFGILRRFHDDWTRGELAVKPNRDRIDEYDRRRHVARLASILRPSSASRQRLWTDVEQAVSLPA
jgi:glycosyltransferase involved in cell wall biosynthesis